MAKGDNDRNGKHPTGGGAATQAGTDYQNRIAAWAAVHIIAEQNATLIFGLPTNVSLEYLRCETEQPVDDIKIGSSDGGIIVIQAKHTIRLERGHNSDLASTVKQFVKQYLNSSNLIVGTPLNRLLDQNIDRLVLATGINSPLSIRKDLVSVLNRIRVLTPDQTIDDSAKNASEKEALEVVKNHIYYSWNEERSVMPTDAEIRSLLQLIWVVVIDVDQDGSAEIEAKNLLRSTILKNPAKDMVAWNTLIQMGANFARERSGSDRSMLQKFLLNSGLDLKATSSYIDDIKKLNQHSMFTLDQLARYSTIRIGKSEIKIKRKAVCALRAVIEKDSIIIVGEPGAGKSGVLFTLIQELNSEKYDVISLAADNIAANSLGNLRNELGLEHELIDILKNWPGLKPAFLIIDALDAARSDPSIKMFRNLVSSIINLDGRWKIAVSIRKFELRYNTQLQDLFCGCPPTEFFDKEFCNIIHINIPRLNDEELIQIKD